MLDDLAPQDLNIDKRLVLKESPAIFILVLSKAAEALWLDSGRPNGVKGGPLSPGHFLMMTFGGPQSLIGPPCTNAQKSSLAIPDTLALGLVEVALIVSAQLKTL